MKKKIISKLFPLAFFIPIFFSANKVVNAYLVTHDCKIQKTYYKEDYELVKEYVELNYPYHTVEHNPENAWNECDPKDYNVSFVIRDHDRKLAGEIAVNLDDEIEVDMLDSTTYFFQNYWLEMSITFLALVALNILVTAFLLKKSKK